MHDLYTWQVVYTDGEVLGEMDTEDGRAWTEVTKPVKALALVPQETHLRSHCLFVPETATPVFFRRRSIALASEDGQEQGRQTTHCIGWKQGEQGVYLFIFEDSSTLLTDNFQEV